MPIKNSSAAAHINIVLVFSLLFSASDQVKYAVPKKNTKRIMYKKNDEPCSIILIGMPVSMFCWFIFDVAVSMSGKSAAIAETSTPIIMCSGCFIEYIVVITGKNNK
jgi:hypothetical protein